MLLNCGVGEDSWESLGLQGNPTSPSSRKSVLNVHWKDWCWSWKSNSLATCCEELTHLKLPWSWERLKVGGEGDERGWDGWMASPTQWTWVWVSSRSLLRLMSTESVIPYNQLILCRPLLLPPSIFPTSGSFQMSQFFASGEQNIGVSASASVLQMNIQDWSHQLRNSKIFRSYVPGIMDKDPIYLIYFLY